MPHNPISYAGIYAARWFMRMKRETSEPWPALPERPILVKHLGCTTYKYNSTERSESDAFLNFYADCARVHAERERILRGMLTETVFLLAQAHAGLNHIGLVEGLDQWNKRLASLRKRYEEIGK